MNLTQDDVKASLHLLGLECSTHSPNVYYVVLKDKPNVTTEETSIYFQSHSIKYKQQLYIAPDYAELMERICKEIKCDGYTNTTNI